MKTRKKQTRSTQVKKRTLLMTFSEKALSVGEKLVVVKNYFKQKAVHAISIIKNFVRHKKDSVVKKSVLKKPAHKKPIASASQKKRTVTTKKKVARVKDASDINIYA